MSSEKSEESATESMVRCARSMFEAYNAEAGGLTYDGKPIPPWDAVGPQVRRRWCAAFLGVCREIGMRPPTVERATYDSEGAAALLGHVR